MIGSCVQDTWNPNFANGESSSDAYEGFEGSAREDPARPDQDRIKTGSDSPGETQHETTQIDGDGQSQNETVDRSLILEEERAEKGR